jgi:hypothetical protein
MANITVTQVKQHIERWFGDHWLLLVLTTGGWSNIYDTDSHIHIFVHSKEIRVYPIPTDQIDPEIRPAVRVAIWDYNTEPNRRDDCYITTISQLADCSLLLNKFFPQYSNDYSNTP